MRLPIFQLDAFAIGPFTGNPAAVVPSPYPLDETLMQRIAQENNLSETAFITRQQGEGDGRYLIRWFTPETEVDLCGHATLASAWVIINELEPGLKGVSFATKSAGTLNVREQESTGLLVLDFPARPPARYVGDVAPIAAALGASPASILKARDLVAVFESEQQVRALRPDFRALAAVASFACIVTAPGDKVDFVSRFFGPGVGVDEDPVTGSAHTTLIPYWAERLGKSTLHALQVSSRGGELFCEMKRDRVDIGGRVTPYLKGEIVV